MNPYDPCVANKIVNGEQMTVTWHINDLKLSHKDKCEIKKFSAFLLKEYEEKLVEHYGNVHDYLGIDLDYSGSQEVEVSMIKYLSKILTGFSEDIGKPVNDPAAEHLFKIRDEKDAKSLPEEKAQKFHHVVAQLLFLAN